VTERQKGNSQSLEFRQLWIEYQLFLDGLCDSGKAWESNLAPEPLNRDYFYFA
jgi:hypothetical protein